MGHERDLARRGDAADIEEMIAVALRRKMLDGDGQHGLEERIGLELRQHLCRRPQLLPSGASTSAEVAELHAGVQDCRCFRVTEDGHRHRAADVGRVHAGMDGILGGSDAADRGCPGR